MPVVSSLIKRSPSKFQRKFLKESPVSLSSQGFRVLDALSESKKQEKPLDCPRRHLHGLK